MEVERFAVIIRGRGIKEDMWYRVELKNTLFAKWRRKKISPFAVLPHERYGVAGSWDIVGDDMYWIGGIKSTSKRMSYTCNELIKHNISDDDPRVWETVSSSMKIPRASPLFFAAVGGKKLYVLLGDEYADPDEVYLEPPPIGSPDWDRCGEVYDIQDKTWHYLEPSVEDFYHYDPFDAAVFEGHDGEPTDIVFYDPQPERPLIFFNFHSKNLRLVTDPPSFAGWLSYPPTIVDTRPILHAIANLRMVFHNNTFYWFARDLRLYAYDIISQTWSVSPCLKDQFPTLQPDSPILVGLGNGKFVVILDEPTDGGSSCPPPTNFTMASLAVQKQQDNCILSVSVESLQAFSLDSDLLPYFGFDAKAIKLKNTGLGTVQGQSRAMRQLDNNICDVSPIRKAGKIDSTTKVLISTFAVGGMGILLVKSLQHRN